MRARYQTIEGVAVVTIPLSDYRDLLKCRKLLSMKEISHSQLQRPARSSIERNPEVAVFLTMRFGLMPMHQILKECKKEFGAKLTPSRQAGYRYWDKVRNKTKGQINSTAI